MAQLQPIVLVYPPMPPFAEVERYVRQHFGSAADLRERVGVALRYRAIHSALLTVFAVIAALLFPDARSVPLASLLGFLLWAAMAAVPEAHASLSVAGDALGRRSADGDAGRALAEPGSIVQAFGDPALTLDHQLTVLDANTAASDVFGGIRIGQHISQTTRNPELAAAVADALRQQQRKAFALELRIPLERHLEGVAAPLGEHTGRPGTAAVLVYLRDLTEQDRLAAMRADFVANASHELRTPLASLKGFIETLQGPARQDPVAQSRFLDIMSAQAERMTRLIDDLLSLSRIEMRVHIPPRGSADLNEIATSVVSALEPQARVAQTSVTVYPEAGEALVRGDHDELFQAVSNLVQNAIKYGRPGGQVDVRIGAETLQRHSVSVVDDGPGIAAEHLPRLTERFYRVSVASSRDRGGTGLGLAIVKHIATRHRGSLSITSRPGQGSTFRISLPSVART